jgi:hypothetical protein
MIAKGNDGLLQVDHGEGAMLGKFICFFIPLHLDPKVSDWISNMT